MADDAPRILAGRYEVGELIGRGGMAEVHIGHDNRLGRTVAIKILRSDLARDPSFQARFRREAQSAAALNHPSIVAVYDTGEDMMQEHGGAMAHVPFIVMEYVEGHTVREILRDGNAVPIEEAVEITSGVLSALEYSHHAGIVHRDIKPANVMLTPTGAVKVMDFGIARALADSAATMTQTQAVIGTAQYLSPEQARGESVDARSDLYSTGCLLFELLTGRPPFIGDSPVSVAYQHVREAPVSPSSIASDVPETLDRITLKALAKERTSRYSSAAEFRSDLEAAVRGTAIAAPSIGIVTAAAAGAAGAGAGSTEIFSAATGGPATQTQIAPAWAPTAVPPSTAGKDLDDDEDGSRRNKGLIWALIAIAVIAVVAIATMILLRPDDPDPIAMIEVPPVAGLTIEEVEAAFSAAQFTSDPEILYELNDTVPKDQAIRTDPAEGESVPADTEVTVWISQGPDSITVPNVTGRTRTDAIAALEEAGFSVVNGDQTENHASIAKDSVVRTDPAADAVHPRGTAVTIYVSSGLVDVPDLSGVPFEEARAQLNDLGLSVNSEKEESDAQEPGTVLRQEPAAGPVGQSSTVLLYVTEAPEIEQIPIPNSLVNSTQADAEATLSQLNLVADIQPGTANTMAAGRVEGTSPAAGTLVDVGSTVTLYVSDGSKATPTPPDDEDDDDDTPPGPGNGNPNGNASGNGQGNGQGGRANG